MQGGSQMSDLVMWSLILGFVSPLIIAVIQQPKFHEGARAIITFLYCVVVGVGTAFFEGRLTGQRAITSVLIVLVSAITTYRGLWRPTGAAPAVEAATSPGDASVQ